MGRENDVAALIARCRKSMSTLQSDYQRSLEAKNVSEDLKIDIKNILENLRACLDYVAKDIHDCFVLGNAKRLYFPIRQDVDQFSKAIEVDFSGLEQASPEVYAILKANQPFNDEWLGKFNRLNNQNKHERLVEQTREESKKTTVSSTTSSSSVSWTEGVVFGSGVSVMGVSIDPVTQLPKSSPAVDTTIEVWVDFKFEDNGESVIPFLEKSVNKVEMICGSIQKSLR